MVYLFVIPLLLGLVPRLMALWFPRLEPIGAWQQIVHNFAVATLIAGSALQGVLEIYGTTSRYPVYYGIVGAGLFMASAIWWLRGQRGGNQHYRLTKA